MHEDPSKLSKSIKDITPGPIAFELEIDASRSELIKLLTDDRLATVAPGSYSIWKHFITLTIGAGNQREITILSPSNSTYVFTRAPNNELVVHKIDPSIGNARIPVTDPALIIRALSCFSALGHPFKAEMANHVLPRIASDKATTAGKTMPNSVQRTIETQAAPAHRPDPSPIALDMSTTATHSHPRQQRQQAQTPPPPPPPPPAAAAVRISATVPLNLREGLCLQGRDPHLLSTPVTITCNNNGNIFLYGYNDKPDQHGSVLVRIEGVDPITKATAFMCMRFNDMPQGMKDIFTAHFGHPPQGTRPGAH